MLSLLRVQVPEGAGPARPKNATFFRADGSRTDCYPISPSALGAYLRCPRRWGWAHLDGIRKPQKKSQAHGSALHAELEQWSRNGVAPSAPELVSTGVLNAFPRPQIPGLGVEVAFAMELDGVVLWGFQDQVYGPRVYDLKTTADLCWAKTAAELEADPQGVIYGCEAALRTGEPMVHLHWVYVTTRRPFQQRVVVAHVLAAAAEVRLRAWLPELEAMTIAKREGRRAIDCATTAGACGDFGGCDYLAECARTAARPGVFLAHVRQQHEERTRREA